MALVVGQNSWVSVAEADTYLTNKIGTGDWFDLSSTSTPGAESKESYLVSAFRWLISSPEFSIDPAATDDNVKNAQIEAAEFLLFNYKDRRDRMGAITSGVTDFDYSKRSETLDLAKMVIPIHIRGLLSVYGQSSAFVLLSGEYDA